MAAKKTKAAPKKPGTRRRRGVKLEPTELGPTELALGELPAQIAELAAAVETDGGAVLARYREPLGGHALLLVSLPVEKVARGEAASRMASPISVGRATRPSNV